MLNKLNPLSYMADVSKNPKCNIFCKFDPVVRVFSNGIEDATFSD